MLTQPIATPPQMKALCTVIDGCSKQPTKNINIASSAVFEAMSRLCQISFFIKHSLAFVSGSAPGHLPMLLAILKHSRCNQIRTKKHTAENRHNQSCHPPPSYRFHNIHRMQKLRSCSILRLALLHKAVHPKFKQRELTIACSGTIFSTTASLSFQKSPLKQGVSATS